MAVSLRRVIVVVEEIKAEVKAERESDSEAIGMKP
jgi:hypothetical protein